MRRSVISTLIAAGILAVTTVSASAGTINFAITYTTQSGTGCSISCLSIPTSLLPAPYTKDFSLTTAQLGTNGSYDISTFIGPTLIAPEPGASVSVMAMAIVSGGLVTDAPITFSETYPVPLLSSTATINLTASGGSFTDFREVSIVSTNLQGVYSIAELPSTPIPEPGSSAAVATGLGLLVSARWSARRRRLGPGI
jgi:hypothetical protein